MVRVLCSYALLGGFVVAWVSVLWQHTRLIENVSECLCIHSMAGCVVVLSDNFKGSVVYSSEYVLCEYVPYF